MKNLIKQSVFAGLLWFGMTSVTANNLKVEIFENQIIVELNNDPGGSTLYFKDQRGEILYREHLKPSSTYRKNLSLEVIPSGTYYLNLDFENKILSTVIIKNENGIRIQGRNSRIIFKPCFKVDGKKVSIFLTNTENKNSQVLIYDSNGILMESLATGSQDLRKTFDFSQVPPGDYLIQVKWGKHNYDKKIRI